MFTEKPSLPRSIVTFDIKPIFEYIKEISPSNETSQDICTKTLATAISICELELVKW